MTEFTDYMALAFDQAEQAFEADEVPVGAVIVSAAGRVVGAGQNHMRRLKDASAHAEMLAIKDALGWQACRAEIHARQPSEPEKRCLIC